MPWGLAIKKLQTSIFLSTGVELQNDELVFALIYLFFPFLLLFLSFSFFLTLLLIALFFTPFPLSPPSFISLLPLCTTLLLLSPPLALFCLVFSMCFFPISKLLCFFLLGIAV